MVRFYVKTSFFDGTPTDVYLFDTQEDAAEEFQAALDQRRDLGQHFGDCASISYGIYKNGAMKRLCAVEFD